MAKTTVSFLPIVKKFVQENLPNHILTHEVLGSGPIAYFQVQDKKDNPGIKKTIFFQKFMYSSQSFRIELLINFNGNIRGGETFQYELSRTQVPNNGATFDYKDSDDLKKILDRLTPKILAKEKDFFSKYSKKCEPYINLLGNLIKYYSDWIKVESSYIYPTDLLKKITANKENKSMFEDSDGPEERKSIERLCKFTVYLINKGYTKGLEYANFDLKLWHFWNFGRPHTKEELEKEKKESKYLTCAVCLDVQSKGDIIAKRDKIFGPYYEFVCKSCLSKV